MDRELLRRPQPHARPFPAQTQSELWDGRWPYVIAPNLGAPPGRATRVKGGYRVTGRWGWASGIMDADWVFAVTLLAENDGPPQMIMVLFPAEEAEVIDTWHVEGLAGSGSNDVRIVDLFVPEHRTLRDMGILASRTIEGGRHPEPIFRVPMVSFATFVAAVPVLGAAQGALAYFRERLTDRVEKGTNARSAESPLKHARLAEADLKLVTAETLIRVAGRQMIAAGRAEGTE